MAHGDGSPLIGRTIAGKFAIEELIGRGAMGAVYRARQLALDKIVAIKVLHAEHYKDPTFSARFQREAKAASRLDHPNSMRVIDFGEESDGLLYIAMEYLDGRDLFRMLQQDWPITQARAAEIISQMLAALAVAHDMGVVHRDLKPENIMVLRGTDDEGVTCDVVKVCDFGIAKITETPRSDADPANPGTKLTTQGIVVGTPEYMSPEQGKGEQLDARSDLYSVGVILYQLLTGRVPFDGESAIGIVLKHVTEEPKAPSIANPSVDPRIEAICLRAMSKKKEARYQTAREMRTELRAFLAAASGIQVSSRPSDSRSSPLPFESAATVSARELHLKKTPSKATPAGTVAVRMGEKPRRSNAMFVVAATLAMAAGIAGTFVVSQNSKSASKPNSSAQAPAAQPAATASHSVAVEHAAPAPANDSIELRASPPSTTTAEPEPAPVPETKSRTTHKTAVADAAAATAPAANAHDAAAATATPAPATSASAKPNSEPAPSGGGADASAEH